MYNVCIYVYGIKPLYCEGVDHHFRHFKSVFVISAMHLLTTSYTAEIWQVFTGGGTTPTKLTPPLLIEIYFSHRVHLSLGLCYNTKYRVNESYQHIETDTVTKTKQNTKWCTYLTLLWCHRSGSTLFQVIACCQMAPSHYLNQCWSYIDSFMWHSHVSNLMRSAQDINL